MKWATHASNSNIKFAVVGLITNNDETAYREEMRALAVLPGIESPSMSTK